MHVWHEKRAENCKASRARDALNFEKERRCLPLRLSYEVTAVVAMRNDAITGESKRNSYVRAFIYDLHIFCPIF